MTAKSAVTEATGGLRLPVEKSCRISFTKLFALHLEKKLCLKCFDRKQEEWRLHTRDACLKAICFHMKTTSAKSPRRKLPRKAVFHSWSSWPCSATQLFSRIWCGLDYIFSMFYVERFLKLPIFDSTRKITLYPQKKQLQLSKCNL